MNPYIIIAIGSLLGMLLVIVGKSFYVQRSKKYELGFNSAFVVYTTKYKGPIYVGIITILIVMFILPDIIAHQQTTAADGTIKYNAAINKVLSWLRASSVGLGVVAQGLGFIIIRKGDQYLKDAEQTLLKKNNLKPVKKDNDGKNPTT